jgi:hypothetical protein
VAKEKIFFDWTVGARHWKEAKSFLDRFPLGTCFPPEDFDKWLLDTAKPMARKRIARCPREARWNGKWRINQAGPNPHQFGDNSFMVMVIQKGVEWKVCTIQEASRMYNDDRIIYSYAIEIKLNQKYAASLMERGLSYAREMDNIKRLQSALDHFKSNFSQRRWPRLASGGSET